MEFPIPQHLKKRDNDYISYTATDAAGTAKEFNSICYAYHMNTLSAYEFICLPRRDRNDWQTYFIDPETYLRFVDILKRQKVITEGTEAWIDGDVPKMKIPKGTSRQRAYAALCAYRWAESLSPLAWQVVKLTDDMPEVSLWQILHYVMSIHVFGIGHNWCNIAITDMNYGYCYINSGQSFNMALSLAFPLFWYKTEEELLAISASRTCQSIQEIANSIGPTVVAGTIKMPIPTFLVNGHQKQCDILSDHWTPLYKLVSALGVCKWEAKEVKEQLIKMYQQAVANYKEAQQLREKIETPKKKSGGYGEYEF